MFYKARFILSAVLCASFAAHAQPGPAVQLQGLLSKIKTMQARFTQTVVSEKNLQLQTYSGNMEFKKPNLFRWQVEHPDATLLITDGKKLWNYDVGLEQVTVQKYTNNKEVTPLSFVLDDSSKLTVNFTVEQLPGSCFKLTPKKDNNNFVNVAVCFKKDAIDSVNIVDHLGQTSTFVFTNVRNNQNIAAERFTFKPPAGVDVVGDQ